MYYVDVTDDIEKQRPYVLITIFDTYKEFVTAQGRIKKNAHDERELIDDRLFTELGEAVEQVTFDLQRLNKKLIKEDSNTYTILPLDKQADG